MRGVALVFYLIGVSRVVVARLEGGTANPTVETVNRVARIELQRTSARSVSCDEGDGAGYQPLGA